MDKTNRILYFTVVMLMSGCSSQITIDWDSTKRKGTIAAYTNFIKKYPESELYTRKAEGAIDILEKRKEKERVLKEENKRKDAYMRIRDSGSYAAYAEFLLEYPTSPYTYEIYKKTQNTFNNEHKKTLKYENTPFVISLTEHLINSLNADDEIIAQNSLATLFVISNKQVKTYFKQADTDLIERIAELISDSNLKYSMMLYISNLREFAVPILLSLIDTDESLSLSAIVRLGNIGDARATQTLVDNLIDWKAGSTAYESLMKLKWKPRTHREKVLASIATRDKSTLLENWPYAKDYLLDQVSKSTTKNRLKGLILPAYSGHVVKRLVVPQTLPG